MDTIQIDPDYKEPGKSPAPGSVKHLDPEEYGIPEYLTRRKRGGTSLLVKCLGAGIVGASVAVVLRIMLDTFSGITFTGLGVVEYIAAYGFSGILFGVIGYILYRVAL